MSDPLSTLAEIVLVILLTTFLIATLFVVFMAIFGGIITRIGEMKRRRRLDD